MDAGVVARVSRVTRVCARLHLVYTLSRMRPCSVRRFWVHPILRKRLQRGEYHLLVQELRLDDRLFQRYFRMSKEVFDELLGKVGPLITKVDTHLRMSIDPAERLAICLRYLATGDSYATIAFSYRVGRSTVAVIVKEVAGAIWTALVEECMPVPQVEDWSSCCSSCSAFALQARDSLKKGGPRLPPPPLVVGVVVVVAWPASGLRPTAGSPQKGTSPFPCSSSPGMLAHRLAHWPAHWPADCYLALAGFPDCHPGCHP
ncbi:uncharacterized protein LOC117538335 [Gymnodraco acuticeps]|uniref:Uncharacterized protein LOC117538335 n=1 Tax=Gymnodraco acuticeps TaxID=8218 RepID=A0A6P8T7U7_GYMAC|nr:uncharacterized protein LOC117538335 [Gymnodraco acuticeps]